MTTSAPFVEALGEAGYRLTEPRRVVAELVGARSGHFTANDLIDDAGARDIDIGRATIFRALDLFTELGVLERIDLPSGDHAYVSCLPDHHHHHVICQRCGKVTEVPDLGLGEALRAMERASGWRVDRHRLELFGCCPECRQREEAARDPVARWDERYAGREYLWDVRPNRFVERYLTGATPGTAIDLAAGEGRNAVWLARQGWQVIAVDFSQVGLDKAARLAAEHEVAERVKLVKADALVYSPPQPVDLVVIAYLQLSDRERRTALEHAATWLRPGGRILVVAHDRSNIEHGYGGPSDPDRCYEPAETVEALAGLTVEMAEVVQRPVENEDGTHVALDTLVIASKPAG
jgi:Fe2+ or Zn2+ uptake regulation protein/2-polyprenyl-3-methyl-5-hydroxy-6-metoxy-1,4-benzoquinol methylase